MQNHLHLLGGLLLRLFSRLHFKKAGYIKAPVRINLIGADGLLSGPLCFILRGNAKPCLGKLYRNSMNDTVHFLD
jgi:hypothetical protein